MPPHPPPRPTPPTHPATNPTLTHPFHRPKPQVPSQKRDVQVEWWDWSVIENQSMTRMLTAWATSTQSWFSTEPTVTSTLAHCRTLMVISNIACSYGAMNNNGGNYGFMGFGLLGLWVSDYYFFFLVFLVLLCMGFLVFDFFLWVWLQSWIVVEMAVCWLCWWWFGSYGYGCQGLCWAMVVVVWFFFSCRGLWLSHKGCC